jgi:ribosomal protein S18 acetylase RimI-like enzyme
MTDLDILDLKPRLKEKEVLDLLAFAIGFPTTAKMQKIADEYQTRGNWYLFGLARNHKLIGLIGIDLKESSLGNILHISVSPKQRSQGTGRILINLGLQKLQITTLTAETDAEAKGFYERCNFQIHAIGKKGGQFERFSCVLKK